MTPGDAIRAELVRAARELGAPDHVEPQLERPRDPAHGAWATNLAMTLARTLRRAPRDIAQALAERLQLREAGVERIEVAGAGFINFHLAPGAHARGLADIVAAGNDVGRSDAGRGQLVNVEFVSANPTGPLHVGHGRQAALGDAIATLLEWTGWKVSREYYYNDAGVQIRNLGLSVEARIRQIAGAEAPIPEGGYHGEYVAEIAARYVHDAGAGSAQAIVARLDAHPGGEESARITRFAVHALRDEQDQDLAAFGVRFDTYALESDLYRTGAVEETVRALLDAGHAYEADDALWLRSTDFGDDKDRVMRKRDGTYTYFVPDVAYHVTKWRRGFHRAINVQGADHHSTVTRVRAGLQALGIGIPEGYPEYVLHQMVTVMRGGQEVKLSKRAGSYVTVRDLVEDVGRDAVRYFFVMRKRDSQLEFDVDLARSQSEENPVYYIQMAHARMCGIFRVGEIDPATVTPADVDYALLSEPEEQELITLLLDFPAMVSGAADALEPQRVASYLHDLARAVHLWYHKHHVLNEPEAITRARLLLARAAQMVLRAGLTLLGIAAPERM
ncbi:MAG TPA: arginine--tRNA ligase [Gemmatimonadaceae bacterium]|nr:arginine--tRNA ligase [Gemmatimonadaceae bacterium]